MTEPTPVEAVARVAFVPRGQLLPTTLGTSRCVEALIRVTADDDPGAVTVVFAGFPTGAVESNAQAITEMAQVLLGILPETNTSRPHRHHPAGDPQQPTGAGMSSEIHTALESAETPREAVYLALGAASMCWEPRPGDQVFQPERADAIGKALLDRLTVLFRPTLRLSGNA